MSRDESPGDFRLYRSISGPCPYLEDAGPWVTSYFIADSLDPAVYESMLEGGWRRSGKVVYRNECQECSLCIPLRVDAARFAPTPSQRRCARRNADIELELSPLEYREDRYLLYRKYVEARHAKGEGEGDDGRSSYARFLLESALPGEIADYYAPVDGKRVLVGSGYLDVLPNGLSSVYFAFDPEHCRRSLGVYSAIREIGLAASRGMGWYYLGFWVPGARKMEYKDRFAPHQTARGGTWRDSSPGTER